jgi:alpha-tubulin suppressor-like RCC1 family protein
MATFGPNTGFTVKDPTTGLVQDIGNAYVSKSYILDNYANLPAGTTTPGIFTCGYNSSGELGNNTRTYYSSPIQVGSLTNWKQVTAGAGRCFAIKTNGTLWAWGNNVGIGNLGNGNTSNYSSPIQIGSLTTWKQISSFYDNQHAIKTDGTLWGWGDNTYGWLGTGSRLDRFSSPVQIGALTNWLQVSCGRYHTMAVKTDGTLWACGYNIYGQLGTGNTTYYSSPIQIGSLTNWKQVVCGENYNMAIKNDGTLWGWGSGYIGVGTTTLVSSPIQIGSLTDWKQVSCGANHTMAIKTDGTLWGWGTNFAGQLGNGTATTYSSPIQIGSLTNWKQISISAGNCSMAIKTDGTLWGWGQNNFGELGIGNRTSYSSPIQIGSLTSWKQVSVGTGSSIFIRDGYM